MIDFFLLRQAASLIKQCFCVVFKGFVVVSLPERLNIDRYFSESRKAPAGKDCRITIAARGGVEK